MNSAVVSRTAEMDTFSERHYTIAELAQMWSVSYEAVRRLFDHEPGVFRMKSRGSLGRREYATVRIPETVARRVRQRQIESVASASSRSEAELVAVLANQFAVLGWERRFPFAHRKPGGSGWDSMYSKSRRLSK